MHTLVSDLIFVALFDSKGYIFDVVLISYRKQRSNTQVQVYPFAVEQCINMQMFYVIFIL